MDTKDKLDLSNPNLANSAVSDTNVERSKSILTLQEVKNCIDFPSDSETYILLERICDCWFAIGKKNGLTDSESSFFTLDKLDETITQMSKNI
jgi:hypothetical protein